MGRIKVGARGPSAAGFTVKVAESSASPLGRTLARSAGPAAADAGVPDTPVPGVVKGVVPRDLT